MRTSLRDGLRVLRVLRSKLDAGMALIAGLVIVAGIAGAADRQHTTADVAGPRASPILFRLDRPGRAPSYVFGTLHSADPRVTELAARVARTMQGARTFAMEAQLGPGDIEDFFRAAQLPDGHELGDWMPPDAVTEVERALGDAVPPSTVRRLKPWAAFLKLAEVPATGPSLDALLRDAARAQRMHLLGLELPEEQIAALDSIPLRSQLALLRYVLRERTALLRDHEAAVNAWLAGDLRALARVAAAPGSRHPDMAPHFAALHAAVIDARSALLAHRLFVPLRSGGVFVAVGASHLAGPQGLLALLRAQGYRVTRLR